MQPHFDGETYRPEQDGRRLGKQIAVVGNLMNDGQWRTLRDIAGITGYPEASISARLRDYRKPKFGGYIVDRMRIQGGLFAYRMIEAPRPPLPGQQEMPFEGMG